jgi:hypothetical protein
MRLVLYTLPTVIAVGYLLGGRLRNLSHVTLRYPAAGVAGLVLQVLPVRGTVGFFVVIASLVLMVVFAGANWRLAGFALVAAGLWSNLLVLALNDGMPVTASAFVASGQTEGLDDLGAGGRHHLATPDDDLVFLGDAIALPSPINRAVSIGDLVAYAGAMWFVVTGMRAHGRARGAVDDDAEAGRKNELAEATA